MEPSTIFTQLSLVLLVVVAMSVLMRLLRQPLIIGYIISGVVVGPSFLHIVQNQSAFDSFSVIGITLLLFIIGLGLNAGVIQSLGKVAFLTSMSILPLLGGLTFGLSILMGYNVVSALVIAMALFFSSTIIVMKVLSDKKETTRLFGQIVLGVLLIEDVVAMVAVVVITMIASPGTASFASLGLIAAKAAGLGIGLYLIGNFILPRIVKSFARSQEMLFIFSVAWGFLIATLFDVAGFSHEVGALFAGVSLAGLPYAPEMAAKLKPLRDFFIVIFFVTLGESFTIKSIEANILPALLLSSAVVLGKPLFVFFSLSVQGYTRLTSFKTALNLSQISEFSIIFVTIAAFRGVVSPDLVSLVTLVAFITIAFSSYLMKHADGLFAFFEATLKHFERAQARDPSRRRTVYPIILFGYHKGGYEYIKVFREMKERYIVIDYDPAVIDSLEEAGIRHAYGDATDEELLEEINTRSARLVVSTMTDKATNLILLSHLRANKGTTSFICHANNLEEAEQLYEAGASYVTMPHYIGSERVGSFLKRHGIGKDSLRTYREKHLITIGRQALKS